MMEGAAWSELCISSTSQSLQHFSCVTAAAFDTCKELYLTGTQDGRLLSYYSGTGEKRTSVRAHSSPVVSLHSYTQGILSLSQTSLLFHTRGGVLRATLSLPAVGAAGQEADEALRTANTTNIQSTKEQSSLYTGYGQGPQQTQQKNTHHLFSAANNTASAAGVPTTSKPSILSFDIVHNQCVRQLQVDSPYSALLQRGISLAACGRMDGRVDLRDMRSFRCEHVLSAHMGAVSSLDISDHLLVTCGYVNASDGAANSVARLDPLVKVFDMRTSRQLSPLMYRFGNGPLFVSFLPYSNSILSIMSLSGLWQCADVVASFLDPTRYQCSMLDNSVITCCQLSSSGEMMIVGDSAGLMHQWGMNKQQQLEDGQIVGVLPCINSYSTPVDYVTVPSFPEQHSMSFDDPLSVIPFPYLCTLDYRPLASDLTETQKQLYLSTEPIPLLDERLIEGGVRWHDYVGYAQLRQKPSKHHRHQRQPIDAAYDDDEDYVAPNSLITLRRYAGKGRLTSTQARFPPIQHRLLPTHLQLSSHTEYARLDFKLPKFGLHTFDFTPYNSTPFTALDSILPNSYCNSLVQCLYFIDQVHIYMLSHLCTRENCLQCELGFLYHMLDVGSGRIAEPRNFLRTLRMIPEAGGLGLLEEMDYRVDTAEKEEEQAELEEQQQADKTSSRYEFTAYPSSTATTSSTITTTNDHLLSAKIQDCYRFLLEQLKKEDVAEKKQQLLEHELNREQQWLYAQQQLQKKHRAITFQLRQLQQQVPSTPQQIHAIQALTAEAHRIMSTPMMQELQREHQQQQLLLQESPLLMDAVFGHRIEQTRVCSAGQHVLKKEVMVLYQKLVYSQSTLQPTTGIPVTTAITAPISFATLLTNSLADQQTNRVWCEQCNTYQILNSRRCLLSLPNVLNLECNIQNEQEAKLWRQKYKQPPQGMEDGQLDDQDKHWLPLYIRLDVELQNNQSTVVTRLTEAQAQQQAQWIPPQHQYPHRPFGIYQLTSVISHITDPADTDVTSHTNTAEHLVTHINIERNYWAQDKADTRRSRSPTSDDLPDHSYSSSSSSSSSLSSSSFSDKDRKWFIFNDFSIQPSTSVEATRFDYPWKQACIVVYSCMDPNVAQTLPYPPAASRLINPFLSAPFTYQPSLSLRADVSSPTFTPLQPHERFDRTTRVAIDCEFVLVQPELMKKNKQGERVVVRSARSTLARVSVVRGSGDLLGVPLMDDYIATSEPVLDYLTQYSGLVAGDLDRSVSPHYLTTLKQSYTRLRLLVDHGVVFIGHGLASDLQMLNLVIPASQLIDTVQLYSLPNQRKLSLRFLATHVLNINIQQDTHDSIEDARTALALVHKYEELARKGKIKLVLQKLYQVGHAKGFKV